MDHEQPEHRDEADLDLERAEREMAQEERDLERRLDEFGEEIDDERKDWERKRSDRSVPGANPRNPFDVDEDEGDEIAGDWKGEGPAAGRAGQ